MQCNSIGSSWLNCSVFKDLLLCLYSIAVVVIETDCNWHGYCPLLFIRYALKLNFIRKGLHGSFILHWLLACLIDCLVDCSYWISCESWNSHVDSSLKYSNAELQSTAHYFQAWFTLTWKCFCRTHGDHCNPWWWQSLIFATRILKLLTYY